MFSIDLYSLLSMDAIYDFDTFATSDEDKEWLNGFYDGFMENSRCGDLTYGIPWQRSTIILYYNKDAYREVGLDPETPPTTWTELEDYAQKLTKVENGVTTRYGIQIPSDKAGYAYWMKQQRHHASDVSCPTLSHNSAPFSLVLYLIPCCHGR